MDNFDLVPPGDLRTAEIVGNYRYLLRREWEPAAESLAIVMLNPSTADALADDPTIRRCIGFAKRHGFGGIIVVNLYAYRATDPREIESQAALGVDVVGPENDDYLRRLAKWAAPVDGALGRGTVLVAWGARADQERVAAVLAILAVPLLCLGVTKDGHPRHPLYVKGDTLMEAWPPSVWDGTIPPGGYVCAVCGTPTESEPCEEHQKRNSIDEVRSSGWAGR